MKAKSSASVVLTLVALALASFAPAPAQALDVVLPYGAIAVGTEPPGFTGLQFTNLPLYTAIPGVEGIGFDDSAWLAGAKPFGEESIWGYACPSLWPTVVTPWDSPLLGDLFVRFHLEFCPQVTGVRVGVSVDNDVALYVNGVYVDPATTCSAGISADLLCMTENCATEDKVVFEVPDGLILAGDNVFALHARNRSTVAYLDFEVTADLSTGVCVPPNDPPACEGAFADPGQLWPPNHKWKEIAIGGLTDPNGDDVAVIIDSIFQDEPTDARGNGDGNTCPDGSGIGTGTASVRAERAGGADGRVYHIGFTATDSNGATCQGTVPVCVPHDQGQGNNCLDQGALFDSTVCQ